MARTSTQWRVLVISLPTRKATARMRVWRSLKALGCGVLRDGVYLLPDFPGAPPALQVQAQQVQRSGGTAYVINVTASDRQQQAALTALFDRTAAYAAVVAQLRELPAPRKTPGFAVRARQLGGLRRQFADIAARDFFPGPARAQAEAALADAERALARALSPDEPQPVAGHIKPLRRSEYRARLWATRKRPWIDRLASAWLIKRFIDRGARFAWLERPRDCPARAVGFDFDGAAFTHVGNRVTFEVLAASFSLAHDAALARIGAIVHYLDAGGIPVAEAQGLKTILQGARNRIASDDRLLAEAQKIFDNLYAAFTETGKSIPP